MHKFLSIAAVSAVTMLLAGCGGDAFKGSGSTSGGSGSGGSGSGGSTTPTYSLGSGTGANFSAGAITFTSASLSAGGSTSLSVNIVDQAGTLYNQAATITFNSPCIAAGTALIQPTAAVATSTGTATATYVAQGCSGTDVVQASATVGSTNLVATGTVTVAPGTVGSISFVSATPTNIALKGTGDSGRPESSTVVFKVLDSSGGPRAGANVKFTLNTSVGGLTLTPTTATATSDAQGLAQIVVNAGTAATSVKVTAAITDVTPNITSQSNQLTVTTGIPTAANFSAAVGCYNIEGWDHDGIQTTVTARLADRFQNPVPDGTSISFHAKGGKIDPQCPTATVGKPGDAGYESGLCVVNFTSQAQRPTNGRVPLLAYAIGEESFTDANGNGVFDAGEAFVDTSEPFEDDTEAGAFVTNDFFFDFNNNGTRDGPDGSFNGVLCNDSAHCAAGAPKSVGIGSQNIVILSGSNPVFSEIDANGNTIGGNSLPPITITTPKTVNIWVRDLHDNPLAGTTKVDASVVSVSPASYTLNGSSSFVVPCTAQAAGVKNGATVFSFLVSATTTGTGQLNIKVTNPSGLITTASIMLQ
jgi:hypothetical protein